MRLFHKKKKNTLTVLIVFIGVVIGAFLIGYLLAKPKDTVQYSKTCEVDSCVQLTANGAKPNELSVKLGSTVQFNSADGKVHKLSLGEGGEEHAHTGSFQSGEIKADEGWRATFSKPGTYFFHDHYNPDINVLVIAYKPDSDTKIR